METKIFDYGMNGEGVCKINGKITLVPYSLKDELIEIDILLDKNNYSLAKVNKIITTNPHRTPPVCPYFYSCGGCQLQHMDCKSQLEFKTLLIKKTIKKILNVDCNVSPTIPCDFQYNYRNKGTFAVKDNKIGYFKHSTNEILDINLCPIQDEDINKLFSLIKSHLTKTSYLDKVKNIVIRAINNQYLVGIVLKEDKNIDSLYANLSEKFNNIGLYKIINNRKDSVVISGKVVFVDGIREITLTNYGITYSIDIIGFHQTNINIQNKLYSHILDLVNKDNIVLNAFSGAGLLSAILANKVKSVFGIEIETSSHNSAERLKRDNNLNNLTNIHGDFYKKYKDLHKKIDTIILDPAKRGCSKEAMKLIRGVKEIIYISCNPIAMCKDLREVLDLYDIVEITPFDMFPNTVNVETLVHLKRKNRD